LLFGEVLQEILIMLFSKRYLLSGQISKQSLLTGHIPTNSCNLVVCKNPCYQGKFPKDTLHHDCIPWDSFLSGQYSSLWDSSRPSAGWGWGGGDGGRKGEEWEEEGG
jgi:hypothetical protein